MKHYLTAIANFLAVLVLLGIFASPFFIARNLTKVAGIKSTAPYLITSQIEKFPNVSFSQTGQVYSIAYSKLSQNQEFQELLILTNPASHAQKYQISKLSGTADVFLGTDSKAGVTHITLPAGSSVPVSLFSPSLDQIYSVEFTIDTQ